MPGYFVQYRTLDVRSNKPTNATRTAARTSSTTMAVFPSCTYLAHLRTRVPANCMRPRYAVGFLFSIGALRPIVNDIEYILYLYESTCAMLDSYVVRILI